MLIEHLRAMKPGDPRRSVLQRVIDDPRFALPPDTGPWADLIGSTTCAIDSVEVGYEPGDTMPVRLQVFDGADDTVSCAYMTPEETADVMEGLGLALRRANTPEEIAAREALAVEEAARDSE